jgi:ankyrin repeat protein
MKKTKATNKALLTLIARDKAKQIEERLALGLDANEELKVAWRYKPMTLLEYASEKGAIRVATILIKAGAALDDGHFKPLALATLFGRVNLAKLLLGAGANPNVRSADPPNDRNITPLMVAAATDNRQIFDLLLKHRADPRLVTAKGASALSRAVKRRNHYVVERLVRAGCRASGHELHTPAYWGDVELIQLLLRAGADPNVDRRQKFGLADLAPLETAIQERGGTYNTEWLGNDRSRGAKEIRARDARLSTKYLKVIQNLLRAGADPNRITVGNTPLYHAARWGDLLVVKLLLKAGAKPDSISQLPWTKVYREAALHCAAKESHVEIAAALVAAGADTRLRDAEGLTALEIIQRQAPPADGNAVIWRKKHARLLAILTASPKRRK